MIVHVVYPEIDLESDSMSCYLLRRYAWLYYEDMVGKRKHMHTSLFIVPSSHSMNIRNILSIRLNQVATNKQNYEYNSGKVSDFLKVQFHGEIESPFTKHYG